MKKAIAIIIVITTKTSETIIINKLNFFNIII